MRDSAGGVLFEVRILRGLQPSEQEQVKHLARRRLFRPNDVIFQKGDPGDCLHIIQKGRVKICVVDERGAELVFALLSEGDLLGEMAVLDGQPRSATAIAFGETETLCIERGAFLDFLRTSPRASASIISLLCRRLRETDRTLEEIAFLDVAGRLASKLLQMGTSGANGPPSREHTPTTSITQEELAHLVGASRTMVNKVLNSFADLGYVRMARGATAVLNKAELERIARYRSYAG